MPRLRSMSDVNSLYKKAALQGSNQVNFATQVSFRSAPRPGGYIHRLNRQQRKTGSQLKGLPGCGQTVRDWMTGY